MNELKKGSHCTAFKGVKQIAAGNAAEVALMLRALASDGHVQDVLIFQDSNGQQIDLNLSGSPEEVLERLGEGGGDIEDEGAEGGSISVAGSSRPAGRAGRPRLGVVAREVTLLPRHWAWLNQQPGGASVALRKLVEEARRAGVGKDAIRSAREAAYRFMSAMAGNRPGFEEASRALFAGNKLEFGYSTEAWPADIRRYACSLAAPAFQID